MAKKKRKTIRRTARPVVKKTSRTEVVRIEAAVSARHADSRDIARTINVKLGEIEMINMAIGERRSELARFVADRTLLMAEVEGLQSVILDRR